MSDGGAEQFALGSDEGGKEKERKERRRWQSLSLTDEHWDNLSDTEQINNNLSDR